MAKEKTRCTDRDAFNLSLRPETCCYKILFNPITRVRVIEKQPTRQFVHLAGKTERTGSIKKSRRDDPPAKV